MKNYSNSNSAIIQPKPVAPRRPSSRILVGSIAALLAAHSAQAANQIWTGGSVVDGNWGTILNRDGAVPGSTSILNSTDIATFNAAIANTWGLTGTPIVIDSATQNIGGISFDDSGFGIAPELTPAKVEQRIIKAMAQARAGMAASEEMAV